jgi:AAA family ATP:ADP antiporter
MFRAFKIKSLSLQALTPRRQEQALAWLLGSGFFLTIFVFWILKPLKKGRFIEFFAADGFALGPWLLSAAKAELLAKELNLLCAVVAMGLFALLSRRWQRERLHMLLGGAMAIAFAAFAVLAKKGFSAALVWAFYIFGDLFNMLMLAALFAFLNDVVSVRQSKQLHGPVVLGGVLGGAVGALGVSAFVSHWSLSFWMWGCFVAVLLLIGTSFVAGQLVWRNPLFVPNALGPDRAPSPVSSQQGGQVLKRNQQLRRIALIVALYEIVSSIIDYQFTHSVATALSGRDISRYFANVYMAVNVVALLVQLLLSRSFMMRLGIARSIIVLPILLMTGLGGFFLVPGLFFATFLLVGDNALNYSLHQSCRESLYVVLPHRDKYAGKAFVDIFVQRAAKGVGLLIPLVLSASLLRWLSLLALPLTAIWAHVAFRAGQRLDEQQEAGETDVKIEEEVEAEVEEIPCT